MLFFIITTIIFYITSAILFTAIAEDMGKDPFTPRQTVFVFFFWWGVLAYSLFRALQQAQEELKKEDDAINQINGSHKEMEKEKEGIRKTL